MPAAHTGRLRSPVRLLASAARGTSQVQRIYERAAAGDLCGTMEMMDLLTAAEVGLEPHRALPTGSPIGYYHVYKDPSLSIGIFVIPAGSGIPLHDHPGMTVLSRVVAGRVTVTSYDVVGDASPGGTLHAVRGDAKTLDAGAAATLFAGRANLHSLVAGPDGAIVLDVISPPYTDETRKCRYYAVAGAAGEDGAVALRVDEPDFTCQSAEYRGLDPGHF